LLSNAPVGPQRTYVRNIPAVASNANYDTAVPSKQLIMKFPDDASSRRAFVLVSKAVINLWDRTTGVESLRQPMTNCFRSPTMKVHERWSLCLHLQERFSLRAATVSPYELVGDRTFEHRIVCRKQAFEFLIPGRLERSLKVWRHSSRLVAFGCLKRPPGVLQRIRTWPVLTRVRFHDRSKVELSVRGPGQPSREMNLSRVRMNAKQL